MRFLIGIRYLFGIAAAIGSLKGPQQRRQQQAFRDGRSEETSSNWRNEIEITQHLINLLDKKAFDRSGLIYGIGHAVYALSDPRANLLRDYARALAFESGREKEAGDCIPR